MKSEEELRDSFFARSHYGAPETLNKLPLLGCTIPVALDEVVEFAGETSVSRLMLFAAIMIEIPILMIFFSRVLQYSLNR
ncbi:MAG: hypothetical protein O2943_08970 [Actinomycetota bacterium]|nr:hypothetical protein [Actinomycetota bacterium]